MNEKGMNKTIKKLIKYILLVVDHFLFVCVFPFCLIYLLCATPWILKQRRIWNHSVKGSRKALILRKFTIEKVMNRGFEYLLPYRNPSLEWIGFLDPRNSRKANIEITDDLHLIAWQVPILVKIVEKMGFVGTSVLFREFIAILKITSYCVNERIGVLRAYKYNYPALEAYLVSRFIKIPFIVDIAGNYELVRRLTGKAFYFRRLNKLPVVKIFARIATNWLLGLPLRHASRVLGRNKNNYEYAFALGAPVDRLSLLRVNNFSAAFNSYNPEQPPKRPANYPYILFVGRLAEIKYPLDVIEAFNIAAPHLPEYHLVIIGDGAMRDDVEQRRDSSRYRERIKLLGACSSDIVLHWTAHAKVAICPYSGSTLVEAMLCCIPVVAYDVENHAEIVIDDYTGFLVPFRNIEALAEKVMYVARNYDELKKVGIRGRELARVAHDKEKISEKESMYYMQALTEP
jgi:glycosyltransferase involved in cell wall biosynthesis